MRSDEYYVRLEKLKTLKELGLKFSLIGTIGHIP